MEQMIAGRYRLGEQLGAGGMGRVVEGVDTRLDRRVAIKLVPTSAVNPEVRERFRREARSSARFTHHNAVATYDAGESDGYLYLVMELVDGPSLAHRLATAGQLSVADAVEITECILAALQAAHAAGIVHRDVKPSNVLLGANGQVKLADFGIAKRLDDAAADLTGTGRFVGTPRYLAPEQVAGEPVTAATDLYATGVVLFEMLTGDAPYDGGTPLATAMAHRSAPIPDVRSIRSDVPQHVAAVVAKAMAKDPADRFRSAASMRAALSGEALPATMLMGPPAVETAVMPPYEAPESTRLGRITPMPARETAPSAARWWLIPAVLLIALAVGAVLLARRDDGGESPSTTGPPVTAGATTAPATGSAPPAAPTTSPPEEQPPATEAPTTAARTTTPPTTATPTEPPPTDSVPTTVEGLLGFVQDNPNVFAPRTQDLLDALRDINENGGGDGRASGLLAQMIQWVATGEVQREAGEVVIDIVAPRVADPGQSGPGDGDEDDEGGGEGDGDG